jgi:hypothetical protein
MALKVAETTEKVFLQHNQVKSSTKEKLVIPGNLCSTYS